VSRLLRIFAVVVVCAGPVVPAAQSIYRSETRVVVLYATVTNTRGELITTLDRNAFRVFENGKPQPITLFRNDDLPLSLGILIDNSGSMRSKRSVVEAAALALVRASNPQDEVFVLNFADKPALDVPFTSRVADLERGIGRIDSVGGTAMRDAVESAEQYMQERATRDRKALLIITDGNDNASVAGSEEVRRIAERDQIAIHAIGLLSDDDSAEGKRARHELDELADATGGLAFYAENIDEVGAIGLKLAREIRSQYLIAYEPLNQARDGSFRRIRVTAKGEAPLVVHTRRGYRSY
jgi:Ca-activated chloride channel family protein